jgi:hypothetical protein
MKPRQGSCQHPWQGLPATVLKPSFVSGCLHGTAGVKIHVRNQRPKFQRACCDNVPTVVWCVVEFTAILPF